MPLPALAIAAITAGVSGLSQIASNIKNRKYATPKNQIKRLREAGVHPSAFYSMGTTGNVQGSLNIDAAKHLDSATNFVEGSQLAQPVGQGKNLGQAIILASKGLDLGKSYYQNQAMASTIQATAASQQADTAESVAPSTIESNYASASRDKSQAILNYKNTEKVGAEMQKIYSEVSLNKIREFTEITEQELNEAKAYEAREKGKLSAEQSRTQEELAKKYKQETKNLAESLRGLELTNDEAYAWSQYWDRNQEAKISIIESYAAIQAGAEDESEVIKEVYEMIDNIEDESWKQAISVILAVLDKIGASGSTGTIHINTK